MTTNTMIADAKLDLTYIGIHTYRHGAVACYAGMMHHLQSHIPVEVKLTATTTYQIIEVKALYLDHLTPADLPANPSESAEVVVNDKVITVAGRCVSHSYCENLNLTMQRNYHNEDWTLKLSGDGATLNYTTTLDHLAPQLATMAAMHDLAAAIVDNYTSSAMGLTEELGHMQEDLDAAIERGAYSEKTRAKAMSAIMDLAQAEISIKMAEAGLSMTEITNDLGLTPREQSALWGQIVDCSSPQMPFSGDSFFQHLTGHDTFEANQKKLEKKIDAAGQRLHDVRNTGCLLGDRLTERLEQMRVEMAHSDALYEDHQRDIYEEAETDHHDNAKAEAEAEMAA